MNAHVLDNFISVKPLLFLLVTKNPNFFECTRLLSVTLSILKSRFRKKKSGHPTQKSFWLSSVAVAD